jgi:hypothetical protein
MPFQSKKAVKVTDIPSQTTREQYFEFVEHLCKPQTKAGIRSFFGFSKPNCKAPSTAPSTAVPRAQSLDGASDQASLQQDSLSLLPHKEWCEATFERQGGYTVGTISFASREPKEAAIRRHREDKTSPWKDWKLSDNFDYLTVLYDASDEAEVELVTFSLPSGSCYPSCRISLRMPTPRLISGTPLTLAC